MWNKTLLVALSAVAFLIFGARDNSSQETKGRDLSRYKDGGTYNLSWSREDLESMRAKARAFLWEHWSQRRLGRVTVTFYSIEGEPTRTSFYIEPDERGAWLVAAEYEKECCWFYGMEGKERKLDTGRDFYNVVERVADNIRGSVIPERENRQPNTYALRLRKAARNQEGSSKEEDFIL